MYYKTYHVLFSNGDYQPELVIVDASCMDDAIILAQAKRIKQGLDRTIKSVKEVRQ